MKSFLSFILLMAVQINCEADYWNSDLQLPRLNGVRKILVKETRWDYTLRKAKTVQISRSVLWLNKDGLVIKEDNYEQHPWIAGYNIYEYAGNDTVITTIRGFVYPGMQLERQRPTEKDSLIQTIEFVNEHSDPQRHDWLVYGIDSLGLKRLMNSTSTQYNSNHQEVYRIYKTFEHIPEIDSTAYQHAGDTLIAFEYSSGTAAAVGQYFLKRKEIVVRHRDSRGRVIYSERIADTYTGTLRKSHFIYDKHGRYLGERYEQQCEHCKTGWQRGR
jgi:hypothetical protein